MPFALSFTNPGFLWVTPLAAVVVWWWLWRNRPAMGFTEVAWFKGHTGGRALPAMWGGALLRGFACLLLILACAGPRRPDLQTKLPAEGIAIMMAIDISGSMDTPDVAWNAGRPPGARV